MARQAANSVQPVKPMYEKPWFEGLVVLGALLAGYWLWHGVMMPVRGQGVEIYVQALMMLRGDWQGALFRVDEAPLYATLLALVMKFSQITRLPELQPMISQLQFGLYAFSVLLTHAFARLHIRKPYSMVVTVLYALTPATLLMGKTVTPAMLYMVLSLLALLVIDRAFGRKPVSPLIKAPVSLSTSRLVFCGLALGLACVSLKTGYLLLLAFAPVMMRRMGIKRALIVMSLVLFTFSPFVARDIYQATMARRPMAQAWVHQAAFEKDWPGTIKDQADTLLTRTTQNTVGQMHLHHLNPAWADFNAGHVDWLRWAMGGLLLIGLLYGFLHGSGIGGWYLMGMALSAVMLDVPESYLALGSPLLLLYAYFGLMRIGEWMRKLHLPISRIASPALTLLILLCGLTTYLHFQHQAKSFQAISIGVPVRPTP